MSMDSNITDVTKALLDFLRDSGIKDSFLTVPAKGLPRRSILSYWNTLSNADTLKYRWSDTESPTARWATDYCLDTPHMYFVVDTGTGRIVAEFALCNFIGKAAQVHFSMDPLNEFKLSVFLADEVTNMILQQWKDVKNLEESFIDTLFGLTPVDNRVACIFIRKAGFKAVGTLASGATYLNDTVDALLTTKSRLI